MMQTPPEQALRLLVARRSEMLAYIFANTLDMHVAEDIYQDVLVKVMMRQEPYENEQHVMRWAQRVARNAAIDLARSGNAKVKTLDAEVLDRMAAEWDALDPVPHSDLIEYLRLCLDALTPAARNVLELRYREGLTGAALGERLGRPVKSVYVTLSRAYRALAECIERHQRRAERG